MIPVEVLVDVTTSIQPLVELNTALLNTDNPKLLCVYDPGALNNTPAACNANLLWAIAAALLI